MACACDVRYVLDEPSVVCTEPEPLGVLGTAFVRAERAVSGVGALIIDFFGVSVTCLLPRPVVDERRAFAVPGAGLESFARLPAVTKGWRSAA